MGVRVPAEIPSRATSGSTATAGRAPLESNPIAPNPEPALPGVGVRDALLLLLAVAAGASDAIAFLGLDHVFTANMTGNTVLLGLALARGHGLAALRSAVVLVGYDVGVALGALIVERRQRPVLWPTAVTAAVALEAVLLLSLGGGWYLSGIAPSGAPLFALLLLSALSMGVQSAAVRRLGVPGVATTYVTGTLTSAAAGLIDRLRGRGVPLSAALAARGVGLDSSVWVAYGIGAILGGAAELEWQAGSVALPLLAVAAVIGVAAWRF